MALVSKKTGKPSDDMREELIDEAEYSKPDLKKSKESHLQKNVDAALETIGDFATMGGRHWEHR